MITQIRKLLEKWTCVEAVRHVKEIARYPVVMVRRNDGYARNMFNARSGYL